MSDIRRYADDEHPLSVGALDIVRRLDALEVIAGPDPKHIEHLWDAIRAQRDLITAQDQRIRALETGFDTPSDPPFTDLPLDLPEPDPPATITRMD